MLLSSAFPFINLEARDVMNLSPRTIYYLHPEDPVRKEKHYYPLPTPIPDMPSTTFIFMLMLHHYSARARRHILVWRLSIIASDRFSRRLYGLFLSSTNPKYIGDFEPHKIGGNKNILIDCSEANNFLF